MPFSRALAPKEAQIIPNPKTINAVPGASSYEIAYKHWWSESLIAEKLVSTFGNQVCYKVYNNLQLISFFNFHYFFENDFFSHQEDQLYIKSKVRSAPVVEGDPKASFSIPTTPRCRRECYFFPGLLHFNLDPYLIILRVKEKSIKCHFFSFWYD